MKKSVICLMLAGAFCLSGCGVTEWQRNEDTKQAFSQMYRDLNSSEMNAAIAAAQPGVPRVSASNRQALSP